MARAKAEKSQRIIEAEGILAKIKERQAQIKAAEEQIKKEKTFLKEQATKLKAAIAEEKERIRIKREADARAKKAAKDAKPKKSSKSEEQKARDEAKKRADKAAKLAEDVAKELVQIFGVSAMSTVEALQQAKRNFNKLYHPDAGTEPDRERCAVGNMFFADYIKKAQTAGRYERRAA